MTNQHPIAPLPEQVDQWFDDAVRLNSTSRYYIAPRYYIARQAALWSADQELEACVEWLGDAPVVYNDNGDLHPGSYLRDARRFKSPSLKEQALEQLREVNATIQFQTTGGETSAIRRALEALPND
jgi:hypothetical protein